MSTPRHVKAPHPREFTDTDPKAMEVWLDLLRKMTPEQRLERGLQLCELAASISEAGVRAAYPCADEREVFLRTAARRLPRECMIQVYGWDPQQHGHAG